MPNSRPGRDIHTVFITTEMAVFTLEKDYSCETALVIGLITRRVLI